MRNIGTPWCVLAACAALSLGCTGALGEPAARPVDSPSPVDPGSAPLCGDAGGRLAEAPLRSLTPSEYDRTLAAIFPGVTLPAIGLVEAEAVDGFHNQAQAQVVSPVLVDRWTSAAESVAAALESQFDLWSPCDAEADDEACAGALIEQLGPRLLRRPLEPVERERYHAFFVSARAQFTRAESAAMWVEALLQSPSFLFRPERGDLTVDAPEGFVALSDAELANRLSYLLAGGPPDAALQEAALAGRLRSADGLEDEARRLLARPAAREVVADFHRQWLEIDRLDELDLDAALYPELDEALRADLRASVERFAEHAFWEAGSLDYLLLGSDAFVNDRIAALLGIDAPGSDELVRVPMDPAERAGLLTQPGMLAATSHGISHSPVFRGVAVLDRVLCAPLAAPPPEVLDGVAPDPDAAPATTTRDHFERLHGTEECAGCHEAIDGVGFAFEHFDALGRFRTEENGHPVDASGRVLAPDGWVEVDGAVELAEHLADDERTRACFGRQWFRYALGRDRTSGEACVVEELASALESAAGDPREMLVALIRSPVFRFLPRATETSGE
ncbi:MAG: DUF1592 domain-containing protein [Myxococcota bacterium]|nr:DUF1592 domain-containing protein [Myxococcota bacterium]